MPEPILMFLHVQNIGIELTGLIEDRARSLPKVKSNSFTNAYKVSVKMEKPDRSES